MNRAAAAYVLAIWEYRFFWLSLVKADLRRRYRRSLIGVGWSLVNPLLMAGILCLVYRQLLNVPFTEFVPFLITGLAFWGFFSNAILQGCTCFQLAEPYIRQEPAPLVIYPLRTVIALGFHFLVTVGMVVVLILCLRGVPDMRSLALMGLALGALFVFCWSLATLAAFANVYFPDAQHLAEFGLQAIFYLTPIIYPPSVLGDNGPASFLHYNPLATLVQFLRSAILGPADLGGAEVGVGQLAALGCCVSLTVAVAVLVIARYEHELVFQL